MRDEIEKANKRLKLAILRLKGSHYMFGVGKYEGFYHGNIRSWQFSKYLYVCKKRVLAAKKKLESLERKMKRRKY